MRRLKIRFIDADALKSKLSGLKALGGNKYYRKVVDDCLHDFFPQIIDDCITIDSETLPLVQELKTENEYLQKQIKALESKNEFLQIYIDKSTYRIKQLKQQLE